MQIEKRYAVRTLPKGRGERSNHISFMRLIIHYFTDNFKFFEQLYKWRQAQLHIWQLPSGHRWNRVTKFQAVMMAVAISVMLVMIFVPVAPARAGFFSTVAVIAASMSALKELMPEIDALYQRRRLLCQTVTACSLAMVAATAAIFCWVEWDVRQQWMSRIDYLNDHRDQELVVVHQIDVVPIADDICEYWGCVTWNTDILAWGSDLEPRPEGSHNIMYAQYYGWKQVITDGEDRRLIE